MVGTFSRQKENERLTWECGAVGPLGPWYETWVQWGRWGGSPWTRKAGNFPQLPPWDVLPPSPELDSLADDPALAVGPDFPTSVAGMGEPTFYDNVFRLTHFINERSLESVKFDQARLIAFLKKMQTDAGRRQLEATPDDASQMHYLMDSNPYAQRSLQAWTS